MLNSRNPSLVTFVIMAGLLSALICQSLMVGEAVAAPSDHGTHEEASHSHHGTHDEENTPADSCCVIQAADVKAVDTIVLALQTVDVVVVKTGVAASQTDFPIPDRTLVYKPPGSLLQQTCALLI